MTLLISFMLLHHIDAGFYAYLGVFALWVFHVVYHSK